MLVLVVLTLIELLIMIVINDVLFANLIQMTIYIILLPLGLFFGIVSLVKGVTTPVLIRNTGYILVPAILFVIALPHFSYQQGEVLVVQKSHQQAVQFRSLQSRTVPVTPGYSWLLNRRAYYYKVKLKRSGQILYYTVSPVTGQVFSSSNDYWSAP